jgi:glycosyltransferase involved in cell wall biosynthesis
MINSLKNYNIEIDTFAIKGRGIIGYLKNWYKYLTITKNNHYDLIHAIYGFSGLFSIFQRYSPVVITYIGTDITNKTSLRYSRIAMAFCKQNIFVSKHLALLSGIHNFFNIIPFGVDLNTLFYPLDKFESRKKLNLDLYKKYALFASYRANPIKNFSLAKNAVNLVGDIEILEMMQGLDRENVNVLINAVDVVILSSFSEGSPQVIKEAMACNIPIVSTDVGDVREIIGDTEGCFIAPFSENEFAEKISLALSYGKRTNGREKIQHLSSESIAKQIYNIYLNVISEGK